MAEEDGWQGKWIEIDDELEIVFSCRPYRKYEIPQYILPSSGTTKEKNKKPMLLRYMNDEMLAICFYLAAGIMIV
jgi:hypothetical protein